MASETPGVHRNRCRQVQQAVLVEDEAPRRSTPRPRKAKPVVNEPLVFVETVGEQRESAGRRNAESAPGGVMRKALPPAFA